jgi:hypothetical protein
MLKKFLGSALFAAALAVGPMGAPPPSNEDDGCLLHNGCVHSGGQWVCPDPQIFMLCFGPGGYAPSDAQAPETLARQELNVQPD